MGLKYLSPQTMGEKAMLMDSLQKAHGVDGSKETAEDVPAIDDDNIGRSSHAIEMTYGAQRIESRHEMEEVAGEQVLTGPHDEDGN